MKHQALVGYGCVVGLFAAGVAGGVDVIVVTLRGTGIPWMLPGLLFAAYLACGLLVGGLAGLGVALFSPRGDRENGEALRDHVLDVCVLAIAGVYAVNFLASQFWEAMRTYFAVLPIAAAAMILLLSALCVRLRFRRDRGRPLVVFLWQVFCVTLAALLWPMIHGTYHASALSLMNVGAFAGLGVGTMGLYWVGRMLIRGVLREKFKSASGLRGSVGLGLSFMLLLGAHAIWLFSRPGVATAAAPTSAPDDAPPVVLLVMDTVRADHLSAYDYHRDTSPNLAAFAKEAVVYERAVSPSSWTLPSHASILTGLMPTQHGADAKVEPNGFVRFLPLDDAYTTLAEALNSFGYHTGAAVANILLLTRQYGFSQGFGYYDDRPRAGIATANTRTISPASGIVRLLQSQSGYKPNSWYAADIINARATTFLEGVAPDAPYFLFLNYMDAHLPYASHPEFTPRFATQPSNAEKHEEIDAYDTSIAYLDAQIGRLFDELRARGDYDRALIIVTADHGEAFGEHGAVGHGHSVYEEEVHVPLLVRYPGGRRRAVVREPVSLTVIPQLVMNVVAPDLREAPELEFNHVSERTMTELTVFREPDVTTNRKLRAVYSPPAVKTIFDDLSPHDVTVFNLERDPAERFDLAADSTDLVSELRAWCQDWEMSAIKLRVTTDEAITDTEELRARLSAMGYLGG